MPTPLKPCPSLSAPAQLNRDTEPNTKTALHGALAKCTEPELVYDRNYVADYMGWQDLMVDTSAMEQARDYAAQAADVPAENGHAAQVASF